MRKTDFVVAIMFLFLLLYSAVVAASQPISVTIDGRALVMDAQPVSRDGRTLVPLRAIFEALGANVEWDPVERTITGTRGNTTIFLQINNRTAKLNGNSITLDVPPAVIDGRTMVPTRFIAESLDAQVNWDGQTRTVSIVTGDVTVVTVRTIPATVLSIIDGDTVRVRLESGKEEAVRLIGVDTPESTREIEPFGKEAAAFTQRRLDGKTVFLEMDVSERDRFGRLLAYVWLDNPINESESEIRAKMFNADLLLQGYAQLMTITPNVKYTDMFLKFEREARNAGKGLWAATEPIGEPTTGVVIASVDLAGEVVRVENRSANNIDISGWILVSERGNQRFTFPVGTVIAAGKSIAVVSGSNAVIGTDRLLWTRSSVWNNDGDPAVLLDAEGKEVSRRVSE